MSAAAPGGVYVHLPFCPYLCPYCDFAKWPFRRSDAARYLIALHAEIENAPAFRARTLFFGGGTPNTYSASELTTLVAALRRRFAPDGFAEITIELNPDADLCTRDVFAAYLAAGIDRFSFGVQSFDAAELDTLGRRHRAADVARAFANARAAGATNLSLDLIFGTPGQTPESWRRTLENALALEPLHVSAYGLTIETGTPYADWFEREPAAFPPNDLEAELFALAIERIEAAGYEQYEISNFARPGGRCAHNANYWANGEYLGLGVGAASYYEGERFSNTRDLAEYVTAATAGTPIPGERERLTGARRAGEAVMLALRTAEGVDVARFAERYGIDMHAFYRPVLEEMHAAGTLDVTSAHVRLTRRGRFVANDVCAAFVTFEGAP